MLLVADALRDERARVETFFKVFLRAGLLAFFGIHPCREFPTRGSVMAGWPCGVRVYVLMVGEEASSRQKRVVASHSGLPP